MYRETGQYVAGGSRLFKKAVRADPELVEARTNLELVLVVQSRYAEVVAQSPGLLEPHPDQAEVWLNMGLGLHDQGETKKATQALQREVNLDPGIRGVAPPEIAGKPRFRSYLGVR